MDDLYSVNYIRSKKHLPLVRCLPALWRKMTGNEQTRWAMDDYQYPKRELMILSTSEQLLYDVALEWQLTWRQIDVLELALIGLTNNQIGQRLSMSPHTANYHIDNIYKKAGIQTRRGLAGHFLLLCGVVRADVI